jgi:hypothetical protein
VKAAIARKPTAKTVVWRDREHGVKALASRGLKQLAEAFGLYHSTRARNAVYGYLTAVYEFAAGFRASRDCKRLAKVMVKRKERVVRCDQNRFDLLLLASSTPAVNAKARWKWSQCLTHAVYEEIEPADLERFIADFGGVNACAAKWVEIVNE